MEETASQIIIAKKILLVLFYVPMVALLEYLQLGKETVFILTVMLVTDTVTGVMKERALGVKPTSTRFANGVLSKLVLLLIPLALAGAGIAVHMDISILVTVSLDILIISEAYSIIANVYTISTGKIAEELDAVSIILRNIRQLVYKMLGDDPTKTKGKK